MFHHHSKEFTMQHTLAAPSTNLKREVQAWYIGLAIVMFLAALQSIAGTDATFSTATTTVTNWVEGSMGKLAAIGALAVGVVTAMVTHKLQSAAVAGGIALVASIGPSVINGIFSVAL